MRPSSPLRPLALLALALLAACAGSRAAAPPPGPAAVPPPAEEVVPAYATLGWTRPREARPGCVAAGVGLPTRPLKPIDLTVKFAVSPEGLVDRFADVSMPPGPEDVLAAVEAAVRGCPFKPGLDPDGRPAYVWVLLPVKVVPLKGSQPKK
jgi:periplasmic protein TonB